MSAELVGCSDIVLLPPLMIKNCLPSFLQVKATATERDEESSLLKLQNESGKRYKVEKSQEKAFYIFSDS